MEPITINNCEFARNGRWGILNEGNYYVGNNTDLVVTNCNIHDNGIRPTDRDGTGGGVYSTCSLFETRRPASGYPELETRNSISETITDNTIRNNAGWAIIKGQHRLGDCVGGYIIEISGNNHNAVRIDATNHCLDTVWNTSAPLVVQRIIVEEDAILTIMPGSIVKFSRGAGEQGSGGGKSERAGLEIRGKLIADGDPGGSLHAFYINPQSGWMIGPKTSSSSPLTLTTNLAEILTAMGTSRSTE